MTNNNITLIGMPGVGKSTIGKRLARKLILTFIDTDDLIVNQVQSSLQPYIDSHTKEEFMEIETAIILNLPPAAAPYVISTGGSVVYSKKAMSHLKNISTLVYLFDELEHIKKRISNLESRGIIGLKTHSFKDLYEQRTPLYEDYAQIKVKAFPFISETIINNIIKQLPRMRNS